MDKAGRDTAVRVLKFLRLTERPQCGTRQYARSRRVWPRCPAGYSVARTDLQESAQTRLRVCQLKSAAGCHDQLQFSAADSAGACALIWPGEVRFKLIGLSTSNSA